jgi:hypothetical protein
MTGRCEGGKPMAGKIILGAIGLVIIAIGIVAAPDLIRYMKIRSM